MEHKDAKQILLKYRDGTATTEEKSFIEDWMLHHAWGDHDLTDDELLQDLADIRQKLDNSRAQKDTKLWLRIAAAAAILLFLSFSGYFILSKKQPQQQVVKNQLQNDFAPGNNKAILTLSTGKQISLTNAKPGILAMQGKTTINKNAPGQVVYHADNNPEQAKITYNTVTTPRGGKWMLTLPDGSKVWLDDSSSICFPTAFTGADRTVEITGQIYFEVVHNAAKPFKVITRGQTVEDLGTHFNINAYADEPAITTTLLEGSVKISKGNKKMILKPGQASVASSLSNKLVVKNVNAEDAVAWKDGYFVFKKASVQEVIKQYARWYDMVVEYDGKIPAKLITGRAYRYENTSDALETLSALGIHCRIENKKITITP